jgi:hypothetical protein
MKMKLAAQTDQFRVFSYYDDHDALVQYRIERKRGGHWQYLTVVKTRDEVLESIRLAKANLPLPKQPAPPRSEWQLDAVWDAANAKPLDT